MSQRPRAFVTFDSDVFERLSYLQSYTSISNLVNEIVRGQLSRLDEIIELAQDEVYNAKRVRDEITLLGVDKGEELDQDEIETLREMIAEFERRGK